MLERRKQEGARVLQAVEAALKVVDKASKQGSQSAARGIIDKALAMAEEAGTPEMKRAVMIAGAQKLEHYCIAAWGTVKALAQEVDARDLAQAMGTAVEEGYRWDAELSDLAESRVNPEALEADGGR
jgi:ferritin-like metal-binding protein YciE